MAEILSVIGRDGIESDGTPLYKDEGQVVLALTLDEAAWLRDAMNCIHGRGVEHDRRIWEALRSVKLPSATRYEFTECLDNGTAMFGPKENK